MSSNPFFEDEVTGTYLGTLVEDMIVTVAREKKLVCNVHIPELFSKDYDYPLVYVPFWAMTLPLREGDQVIVQFNQNDYLYPILYKNPSELDPGFFEKFELGSASNVELPKASDTVSATMFGKDSFVIKTDSYTLIRQNDCYILMDTGNNVYVKGATVNLVSSGNVNVDASGDLNINVSGKANLVASKGLTVNKHLEVKS